MVICPECKHSHKSQLNLLTPQGLVLRGVFLWADNGPLLDLNAKNPKTKKPLTLCEGLQGRRRPTLPPGVAVPSAQTGLTSLFGMERGGPRRHGHLDLQYFNVGHLSGPCRACRSMAEARLLRAAEA